MPARTHFVTTVTLCDAAGRMIWTSSPNPVYKPGPFIWEYAAPEDREKCKNAISRAVVLREPQEFDAETQVGEHYHCWIWPLNSPELAVCVLAVQVPAEMKRLSARERLSIGLLAEGRTTREIAKELDVSVSTVHTHFRRARKKLKLRSVEELIGFAARYCYPASAPLVNSEMAELAEVLLPVSKPRGRAIR
jgi:DNA-binding CsgD family transcriptional regulator